MNGTRTTIKNHYIYAESDPEKTAQVLRALFNVKPSQVYGSIEDFLGDSNRKPGLLEQLNDDKSPISKIYFLDKDPWVDTKVPKGYNGIPFTKEELRKYQATPEITVRVKEKGNNNNNYRYVNLKELKTSGIIDELDPEDLKKKIVAVRKMLEARDGDTLDPEYRPILFDIAMSCRFPKFHYYNTSLSGSNYTTDGVRLLEGDKYQERDILTFPPLLNFQGHDNQFKESFKLMNIDPKSHKVTNPPTDGKTLYSANYNKKTKEYDYYVYDVATLDEFLNKFGAITSKILSLKLEHLKKVGKTTMILQFPDAFLGVFKNAPEIRKKMLERFAEVSQKLAQQNKGFTFIVVSRDRYVDLESEPNVVTNVSKKFGVSYDTLEFDDNPEMIELLRKKFNKAKSQGDQEAAELEEHIMIDSMADNRGQYGNLGLSTKSGKNAADERSVRILALGILIASLKRNNILKKKLAEAEELVGIGKSSSVALQPVQPAPAPAASQPGLAAAPSNSAPAPAPAPVVSNAVPPPAVSNGVPPPPPGQSLAVSKNNNIASFQKIFTTFQSTQAPVASVVSKHSVSPKIQQMKANLFSNSNTKSAPAPNSKKKKPMNNNGKASSAVPQPAQGSAHAPANVASNAVPPPVASNSVPLPPPPPPPLPGHSSVGKVGNLDNASAPALEPTQANAASKPAQFAQANAASKPAQFAQASNSKKNNNNGKVKSVVSGSASDVKHTKPAQGSAPAPTPGLQMKKYHHKKDELSSAHAQANAASEPAQFAQANAASEPAKKVVSLNVSMQDKPRDFKLLNVTAEEKKGDKLIDNLYFFKDRPRGKRLKEEEIGDVEKTIEKFSYRNSLRREKNVFEEKEVVEAIKESLEANKACGASFVCAYKNPENQGQMVVDSCAFGKKALSNTILRLEVQYENGEKETLRFYQEDRRLVGVDKDGNEYSVNPDNYPSIIIKDPVIYNERGERIEDYYKGDDGNESFADKIRQRQAANKQGTGELGL